LLTKLANGQAIGRSRGVWRTKRRALTDVIGRPYALLQTLGNVADGRSGSELLDRIGLARFVIADKGYDADPLRRSLRRAGAMPVIPSWFIRTRPVRYRGRRLIKNSTFRLRDFGRVATHYDKLARDYLSGVALSVVVALWM
jgi:transposase